MPVRAFLNTLSGLVLFAGTASAACAAAFACGLAAALCGAAALVFTRAFVAVAWASQLDPRAAPKRIPRVALAIYAAVGLALLLLIVHRAGPISEAAIEFLVGWAAGCVRADYFWTRRANPQTPDSYDVARDWVAAVSAPHWPLLARLGYALGFALLFGGVTSQAFETGFAQYAVTRCGPSCATPGATVIMAALCGVAAIVFTLLYAVVTEAVHYVLVDSWKHVRPGPPPAELPRWAGALYVVIGVVVIVAIAAYGQTGGHVKGTTIDISGRRLLALLLGWWIGGLVTLRFFWLWRRAAR